MSLAEAGLAALRESTRWMVYPAVAGRPALRRDLCDAYCVLRSVHPRSAACGGRRLEDALWHTRLLIESEAGGGKTTFLRRIVRELCDPAADFGEPLPFSEAPFWIRAGSDFAELAPLVPAEGILLVDALDAWPADARESHAGRLLEIAQTCPKLQIIATARANPAIRDALPGFEVVRIAPLDSATAADAGLGLLVRNPLIFAAAIAAREQGLLLPEQRADVYEAAVEWLRNSPSGLPPQLPELQNYLTALGWAEDPSAAPLTPFASVKEAMLLHASVLARRGFELAHARMQALAAAAGPDAPFTRKAEAAGLVSAIAVDLAPLGFVPQSPAYADLMREMPRIFEKGAAKGIALTTRVSIAEVLGVAGHPSIRLPEHPGYWIAFAGGSFRMGTQEIDPVSRSFDEMEPPPQPERDVTVPPFELGRNPVTVWEFAKFVEAGGSAPADWNEQLRHPLCPVVSVSWHEAALYCAWIGGRLPSEEEWELAARGFEARVWAWGDELPDATRANIGFELMAPSPVGIFPDGDTPEGLADMSGNVWNWTSSLYASGRTARVLRGGSWFYDDECARGAYRNYLEPEARGAWYGFRCARG